MLLARRSIERDAAALLADAAPHGRARLDGRPVPLLRVLGRAVESVGLRAAAASEAQSEHAGRARSGARSTHEVVRVHGSRRRGTLCRRTAWLGNRRGSFLLQKPMHFFLSYRYFSGVVPRH